MSLVKDDSSSCDLRDAPGIAVEPYGEISMFHRSLAGLCRANMPLPQALQNLQGDLSDGKLRDECSDMAREIESGLPFEQAYGRRARRFPPVYRALVEAGLKTGDLPAVLDEIAVDASLRARVRDQLRRRLEMPLLASFVVFVIGAVMTMTLAPTVTETIVPGQSQVLGMSATNLFVLTGVGLFGLLAMIVMGIAMLRKPIDPAAGPSGWRYKVPFLGRLRSYAARAGFAGTMALLLKRQLPLPQALELCAASCDGDEVRVQVQRMAEQARNGAGLAESIRAGELIPESLLWFAESAGNDAAAVRALEDVGRVYRQRLQRATDRVAAFALPAVELMIGLVVLAFALAYVLPGYNIFGILGL